MHANINVSEPKPPQDPDSPLSFTMEGSRLQPPSALITQFWAPGWNSIQSLNKFQQEIDGPLRGGDPGKRLLEPAADTSFSFFPAAKPYNIDHEGEWQLVPIYHIFGSEELSSLSPSIAQLAPEPYILLNPADIDALGSQTVVCRVDDVRVDLQVKPDPALPGGLAGIPVGLQDLKSIFPSGWCKLTPSSVAKGGSSQ